MIKAIVSPTATDQIVLTADGKPVGRGPTFGGLPTTMEEFAEALTYAAQWGETQGSNGAIGRVKDENAKLLSQIREMFKKKGK